METVVLDIEGTVCPIAFVHEVLFPFALTTIEKEVPKINFPLDAKRSGLESYLTQFPEEFTKDASTLISHVQDLTKRDVKIGYLKSLQGYIWASGYETGQIKTPIYPDAVEAIKKWSAQSKVYIYSSGSVAAQILFFKYTNVGDLTGYLAGYFDTLNAGPKLEVESYKKIAAETQSDPSHTRFFSDNPKEIDAASGAGWKTTFVVRPGNPVFNDYKWPGQRSFEF